MVMLASQPDLGINEEALTTPTSTQKYTLGQEVTFRNMSTGLVDKYVYVQAHAALTAHVPYIVVPVASTGTGSEWKSAAPVTNTAEQSLVGVPQAAFTSSYYGFVKVQGQSTVVASTGLVASTFGKVINGGAAVYQGSTGSTPTTADFCSNAGATSTGTSVTANLFGYRVSVTT